jgi:beta-glucosidase
MTNYHTKITRILSFTLVSFATFAQSPVQPKLGNQGVQIIKSQGFEFKDLNKNGKLDHYEDWRLPNETRVKDLISQMTLEEKIGFMLISTTRMEGDYAFQANAPKTEIKNGFNEEDLVQNINMFSKKPLPVPVMSAV